MSQSEQQMHDEVIEIQVESDSQTAADDTVAEETSESAETIEIETSKPDIEFVESDPLEHEVAQAASRIKARRKKRKPVATPEVEETAEPGLSQVSQVQSRRIYSSRLYDMLRGKVGG